MNSPHFDIQIERKAKLSLARTLSLSIPAHPSGSPRRSPRTTTNLKIYCALCLSPLLGGPVRPAPSDNDGGVLSLVRIWHGMKGNRAPAPPIHPILKLRSPPANAAGHETQPVRDSGRHYTPTAQALLLRVECEFEK